MTEKCKKATYNLPVELIDEVAQLAHKCNVPKSTCVRELLKFALKETTVISFEVKAKNER